MKTLKFFAAVILLVAANTAKAGPAELHVAINNVVKCYLGIKNALAADNSKAANDEAKRFTDALKEVSLRQMDSKEKEAWTKYAEKLRYDGEHIGESAAIAHQREHFAALSSNLYAVVRVFQTNDIVLYKQYCPMEKKSWLSESTAIKNPYLGLKMPNCGVTRETLKAAK